MRIGIYGGSFDPPHLGHLNVAKQAIDMLFLDELYIVPAGCQYFKDQTGVASKEDRHNMCRSFLNHVNKCTIYTKELERDGNTYTIDTVKEIKEEHPDDDLFLIIGFDAFTQIHEWYKISDLINLVTFAVFSRSKDSDFMHYAATKARHETTDIMKPVKSLFINTKTVQDSYDVIKYELRWDVVDCMSSSEIKRRIKAGEPYEHYLMPDVAKYIKENKLYV